MSEKEYIERGALMEEIRKHIDTIGVNAERLVARFPAADVEPVVRGRWKWICIGVWECTNCGSRRYTNKNKRCPECGAHMKRSGSGE